MPWTLAKLVKKQHLKCDSVLYSAWAPFNYVFFLLTVCRQSWRKQQYGITARQLKTLNIILFIKPLKNIQHKVKFHKLACKILPEVLIIYPPKYQQLSKKQWQQACDQVIWAISGSRGWSLVTVLSDLRRLFLSLAATCETAIHREPWCLLLFFLFRRFRNTDRHLYTYI